MTQSTIAIDVTLDDQKIPHQILWNASQSSSEEKQDAKAIMISFGMERKGLHCESTSGQKK